jgi:tetratricopeptide (TPR) repeat protein
VSSGDRGRRLLSPLLLLWLSAGLYAGETSGARTRTPNAPAASPTAAQAAMEEGLKLYQLQRASLEAQRLLAQASVRFAKRHDVDSYLLHGNSREAGALLVRLARELDASTRLAFDAIYYLLQHRQSALAQEQWARVHQQIQTREQKGPDPETKRELAEDLFVQGLLASTARKKDEALRLLHMADSRDFPPMDSRQMLILADTLFELQEDGLAVPTYRAYLQHWPDDRQARVHMAASLHASAQTIAAQEELEGVLREDPRFPEANYYLGSLFFDQKRNDEAKARFDEELKLDPRCNRCMAKLAHIAYLAGDDQGCEAWLQKASALDPDWDETRLVRGMLDLRAGRYESAIQHLTKVIEQIPDHSQAHFFLANAYQRSGNVERAQRHAAIFRTLSQPQKEGTAAAGKPPQKACR